MQLKEFSIDELKVLYAILSNKEFLLGDLQLIAPIVLKIQEVLKKDLKDNPPPKEPTKPNGEVKN